MFYPKLAEIFAALLLLFGIWGVGMGFYISSIEPFEARQAASASYLSRKSSGQAIDQGIYMIAAASALGTLAAIARKRSE